MLTSDAKQETGNAWRLKSTEGFLYKNYDKLKKKVFYASLWITVRIKVVLGFGQTFDERKKSKWKKLFQMDEQQLNCNRYCFSYLFTSHFYERQTKLCCMKKLLINMKTLFKQTHLMLYFCNLNQNLMVNRKHTALMLMWPTGYLCEIAYLHANACNCKFCDSVLLIYKLT